MLERFLSDFLGLFFVSMGFSLVQEGSLLHEDANKG
jgi:hypothetical protein